MVEILLITENELIVQEMLADNLIHQTTEVKAAGSG